MLFFEADKSGITYNTHPQSSIRPEDHVFYLRRKATVDCLVGTYVIIATKKFQATLKRRIKTVLVGNK